MCVKLLTMFNGSEPTGVNVPRGMSWGLTGAKLNGKWIKEFVSVYTVQSIDNLVENGKQERHSKKIRISMEQFAKQRTQEVTYVFTQGSGKNKEKRRKWA